MADDETPKYVKIANALAVEANADILLINAGMDRPLDTNLIRDCRDRNRRENIILLPITTGGDADVAYRIARCLQQHYVKVTTLVTGYCKSAGTLLVLGAHEVMITDEGELGPLDVQLMKTDDLWTTSSGLTIMKSFVYLQNRVEEMFEMLALDIKAKSGGQVTFKTAADISSKLVTGLFSNIYSQIEVMHIGESARAMKIAQDYGERLNDHTDNLLENGLNTLIAGYSSHGFVIDEKEARRLFINVGKPPELGIKLAAALGDLASFPAEKIESSQEICMFINEELEVEKAKLEIGEDHEKLTTEKSGDDAKTEEPGASGTTGSAEDGHGGGNNSQHKVTSIKDKASGD